MKNRGEHKVLQKKGGAYFVDIDISVSEWKEMLLDENIFYKEAKEMILSWYYAEDHMATSKTIMDIYHPELNGTPYNGCVKRLSNLILKHLNYRFWVEASDGSGAESFWCIPFEGWHIDYDTRKNFIWKLRDELIQAINETPSFVESNQDSSTAKNSVSELESFERTKDGKKVLRYTTTYERKSRNRDMAIKLAKKKHGRLICEVCGFDFEKTYGELGKDFIEVHHNKPLFQQDQEIEIDPEKDLNCVCSNCHRMIHRNKSDTLTVDELKNRIKHTSTAADRLKISQ